MVALDVKMTKATRSLRVAYVIRLNDALVAVVVDDELTAVDLLNKLRLEDFSKRLGSYKDFDEYKACCHWLIKDVPIYGGAQL